MHHAPNRSHAALIYPIEKPRQSLYAEIIAPYSPHFARRISGQMRRLRGIISA